MDGNLPAKDRQPIPSDHPNSIFTLFAKSHRMNVSEEATSVCSPDLCKDTHPEESYGSRISSMSEDLGLVWLHVVSPPDIENDLASVSENWGNFGGSGEEEAEVSSDPAALNTRANLNGGRAARFQEWIDNIEPGRRPALNFKHTLMPHVPWQYLPSGTRYRKAPNDVIPGLSNQSFEDTGQLNVLLQRHFLQTGFADLELQHLWKHLKDDGLWDDSLIVVAADHGVAFPHARERRRLSRETAAEIAPVPLFIKAPNQKKGETDDAWVETIDILPTIFDILNLDPRVKMDGRSAFSDEVQNRDELRILIRNSFEVLRIPADTFTRERRAIIDRNQRLFGSGADGPERLYEIGPHPELIGQPASAAGEELDVDLSYQRDYGNVGADPLYVPVHVVGKVNGPDREPRDIAVAVNGTIRAVGNTFKLAVGDDGELVSVIVPESAFQKGRNRVQVFAASGDGCGFALVGVIPLRVPDAETGADQEFFLDLLFYNYILRRFVVIDLKIEDFKPEFAGKMNFYLNAVDELERQEGDEATIGLVLCPGRNKTVTEWALRGVATPVAVARYTTGDVTLTETTPAEMKPALPELPELASELTDMVEAADVVYDSDDADEP